MKNVYTCTGDNNEQMFIYVLEIIMKNVYTCTGDNNEQMFIHVLEIMMNECLYMYWR